MSEPDQRLDEFPARRGHLELSDGPEEYLDLWVRPKPPPSASYDAPPTEPTSIVLAAPEMPARRRPLRVFLVAVLVAVLAVGAGLGAGHLLSGAGLPFLPGGSGSASSGTTLDMATVSAKVNPAVVNIGIQLRGLVGQAGAGTGIVLTQDGKVLTNNHVLGGASTIKVIDIGDGRTYPATVAGFDRRHDIAVLQLIGASGLATAAIGDSSTVRAGDAVLGIGNAGGRGGSPAAAPAMVTALNQAVTVTDEDAGLSEQLNGMIQIAADIRPGDSGGPLVNAAGQVIGVDTAASAGKQGFAIPINQAMELARQIIAGSASIAVHIGKPAFIGVSVADAQGQGARVRKLARGGPAARAGLAVGDVITAISDVAVTSVATLTAVMDTHYPGDRLTFTVVDASGAQQSIVMTAGDVPVG